MRASVIFGVLFLAFAAVAAPVHASADVVIGNPPNSNNCWPFGCGSFEWEAEYQQVYASSDFPGPMTITGLDFYYTQFNYNATPSVGIYTISLSTTLVGIDTISSTFSGNIGGDNTVVYHGVSPDCRVAFFRSLYLLLSHTAQRTEIC
jgi:hypothetical protein